MELRPLEDIDNALLQIRKLEGELPKRSDSTSPDLVALKRDPVQDVADVLRGIEVVGQDLLVEDVEDVEVQLRVLAVLDVFDQVVETGFFRIGDLVHDVFDALETVFLELDFAFGLQAVR